MKGFPTLMLYQAGADTGPLAYDGELHATDLLDGVNQVRAVPQPPPTLMRTHKLLLHHLTLSPSPRGRWAQLCGTHRRLDASLSEHAGRVPELDALARKFLVAKQELKEQLHEGAHRGCPWVAMLRFECSHTVVAAQHAASCRAEALEVSKALPSDVADDARTYTDLMRGAINSQDAVSFLHNERRRVQEKLSQTQGVY